MYKYVYVSMCIGVCVYMCVCVYVCVCVCVYTYMECFTMIFLEGSIIVCYFFFLSSFPLPLETGQNKLNQ